jgi:hypothetical protein
MKNKGPEMEIPGISLFSIQIVSAGEAQAKTNF